MSKAVFLLTKLPLASWMSASDHSWLAPLAARRIWQRLRDEHGVACSESSVRHYVHDLKAQRRDIAESYLDLVWGPGEAQTDFGEADFTVVGARRRMSFFVLSFPFSNMGFVQDLPHHLVPRISTAPKVESNLCRRSSTSRGRYAWGFSVPYTTIA